MSGTIAMHVPITTGLGLQIGLDGLEFRRGKVLIAGIVHNHLGCYNGRDLAVDIDSWGVEQTEIQCFGGAINEPMRAEHQGMTAEVVGGVIFQTLQHQSGVVVAGFLEAMRRFISYSTRYVFARDDKGEVTHSTMKLMKVLSFGPLSAGCNMPGRHWKPLA